MCSAALEAFGAARKLSDPIQHANSEEGGCRPSELLDTLIGGVLAVSAVCGRGGLLWNTWFSTHSFPLFLVFTIWSTGTRLAVIMSVQDKLICVRLVMPRCMFNMQLFLSEIVKFRFDRK